MVLALLQRQGRRLLGAPGVSQLLMRLTLGWMGCWGMMRASSQGVKTVRMMVMVGTVIRVGVVMVVGAAGAAHRCAGC